MQVLALAGREAGLEDGPGAVRVEGPVAPEVFARRVLVEGGAIEMSGEEVDDGLVLLGPSSDTDSS